MDEGWDFFEPQSGEDGPPAKQDIDMTIEAPAWVPGQDSSYGYVREGQNSLVREIERRIVRARA